MTTLDTSALDRVKKIKEQIAAKQRELAEAEAEAKEVIAKLAALGFHYPSAGNSPGRKVEPKYRNPQDPSQTWAGIGELPKFMLKHLEIDRDTGKLALKKQGARDGLAAPFLISADLNGKVFAAAIKEAKKQWLPGRA